MRATRTAQRGFTLIEAIVVIVVIGILAAVVAVFIRAPVRSYVDSVGRAEVSDEADLVLRRIARDLRLALPNSIRVSADGHVLELLLTTTGGRYYSADDGGEDAANNRFVLDFLSATNTNSLRFSAVNPMPTMASRMVAGNLVVIYNLGFDSADAYQYRANTPNGAGGGGVNAAAITQVTSAGGNLIVQLANNPFALQPQPMDSPTHRFQVVSGPVTYRCALESGVLKLRRYWNYTIVPNQPDPPTGGSSALIASGLDSCSSLFRYTVAGQRSGLVVLSLALRARNDTDPSIRLVHQVHVDNTP